MPLWEIPLWEQSLLAMQTPRFSVRLRHLHREQALLVQVLAKNPAFPTTAFLTLQNKATMTLPLLHLEDELTRLTLAPHLGASLVDWRSEEPTSELQSLIRISYAVFCLKKKLFRNINQQLITLN